MNAKIKIIARTTPKIIPPTNEAPSNFLPVSAVGTGVALALIEAFVTVDDGALVGKEADVLLVGDVCVVVACIVVACVVAAFVVNTVSVETAETVNQLKKKYIYVFTD